MIDPNQEPSEEGKIEDEVAELLTDLEHKYLTQRKPEVDIPDREVFQRCWTVVQKRTSGENASPPPHTE